MAGAAEAGLRGPFRGAGAAVDADQMATDQQDAVDLRTLRTTGWGCPDSGASRSRPGVAGRERRCRTLTRGGCPVATDPASGR